MMLLLPLELLPCCGHHASPSDTGVLLQLLLLWL